VEISEVLRRAAEATTLLTGGQPAAYIPALRDADPAAFALVYTDVRGVQSSAGDTQSRFTLQSVSKPFVFAEVCHQLGAPTAGRLIGENSTGGPFDAGVSDRLNPMVNAGALIASSLLPGETVDQKFDVALACLSRFAGHRLDINGDVWRSESQHNDRNRAISAELAARGLLACAPEVAVEVYTRQCAVEVSAQDLSMMGATLAAFGRNPVTGQTVVGRDACKRTIASMATAGLYERSGEWFSETGLLSKSGVSGALLSVIPHRGALAAYSVAIDESGTTVRGAMATKLVASELAFGIFDSVS